MLRRWYLTLTGIVLTAGACLAVAQVVPPTYQAKASLLLLPPASSLGVGGNPYLQLGGLTQVVDVVARALTSQEMADTIAAIDANATFTAESDVTTSGPILAITAEGDTQSKTLAVLGSLVDHAPSTLKNLQSALGIAPRSQITSMVLTRDPEPAAVQKTRIRILAVVAAAGLIVTALAIALIDGLMQRRRRRRASSDDATNTPPTTTAPAEPDERRPHPGSMPVQPRPAIGPADTDPADPADPADLAAETNERPNGHRAGASRPT